MSAFNAPCPKCHAEAVPIMWGMPFNPRDLEAAERGEIHLGGCLVFEGMPA